MPSVNLQYYSTSTWDGSCGSVGYSPDYWQAEGACHNLIRGKNYYYRDQSLVIPIGSTINSVTWFFSGYTAGAGIAVAGQIYAYLSGAGISDTSGWLALPKDSFSSFPQSDTTQVIWTGGDVVMHLQVESLETFYTTTHYISNDGVTIDYTPPRSNLFFGSPF